jgi:hypothetical protein
VSPGCTVIVLSKAPVAGFAKTRLIPALGAAGAAALAWRLLQHAVNQALAARLGPVQVCCAPDTGHPAFACLARQAGVTLSCQATGDLGVRMAQALNQALADSPRALLIGTDAPALDAGLLQRAAAALDTADAVFVPARDGGYVLVGLRQPAPSLFDGMAWSTAQVMADTRQRLAAAGLRHVELPALHDIDGPADLVHLPAGWRP